MAKANTWRTKAFKEFPQDADEDGCDTIMELVNRAESTLEIAEGGSSMYDDDMTPRELRKFITELKNYIKRFTPHAEAEEAEIVAEAQEAVVAEAFIVETIKESELNIEPTAEQAEQADEPTAEQKLTARELELSIREKELETKMQELQEKEQELNTRQGIVSRLNLNAGNRQRQLDQQEAEIKLKEQQLEQKLQDAEKLHSFYKEKRVELKAREKALEAREQELQERAQNNSEINAELMQELEKVNPVKTIGAVKRRERTRGNNDKVAEAVKLYNENPNVPAEALAKQLGITRRTLYRYLKKAEEQVVKRTSWNNKGEGEE